MSETENIERTRQKVLVVCAVSFVIAYLIFILGKPAISGGLYWHHIPEIAFMYFVGAYFYLSGVKFKPILFVLVPLLLIPSLLYSVSSGFDFVGVLIDLSVTTVPILVGCLGGKKLNS